MTRYDSGADFEREVKADLEARGYYAVRAAGSHGKTDVLAYHMGIALFVQCKKGGDFPKEERLSLVHVAKEHSAIPVLAQRIRGGGIWYHRLASDGVREPFAPPRL